MIELAQKNDCTGCSACYAACARGAILMVSDAEGFSHPQIDSAKCVNCGLCAKACPVLVRPAPRKPLAIFAAKANDDELRMRSSSGGVFSLLARAVIAEGGIVFGAGFDHNDWRIIHKSAENEGELDDLRGSKYVQSDMGETYKRVRVELAKNRKVLFSGTPCQVSGLKLFLGKEYDNLLLVDVICHAAPSPLAWRKFLEKRLATAYSNGVGGFRDVIRISFRRKNCGWKRFLLSLRFANDNEYLKDLTEDTFLRGFLSELYNRPSCHACMCRELRSGADLTIADYWRVHEKFPQMDDDKGTSLILVNTDKGEKYWRDINAALTVVTSDYDDAVRINPSLLRSSPPHNNRQRFFALLHKRDFDKLVVQLLKRPLWRRVASKIKRICKRIIGK